LARHAAHFLRNFAQLTRKCPGAQIIAFRNIAIHQYFGIDLDLVWVIVSEHLGPLGSSLKTILASLPQ